MHDPLRLLSEPNFNGSYFAAFSDLLTSDEDVFEETEAFIGESEPLMGEE